MLEILGVPGGDCLVEHAMGDISMSVLVMPVADEVKVAKLAARLHCLNDEIDADETLPCFDEVEGALETVGFHPL